MFRLLVTLTCLPALGSGLASMRGSSVSKMQPETVAVVLSKVESRWISQAIQALSLCHEPPTKNNATEVSESKGAEGCEAAHQSFLGSCQKVTEAILQGSEGDKDTAREYLETVCAEPELQKPPSAKELCIGFTDAILNGMSADSYGNRESLDARKLCAGFFDNGYLNTLASEEVKRQEEEKAAQAKQKEEEAERKAEEEKREKEEAERNAEALEAERAKKEAEEKRKQAEQAKAEQEEKAKQAAKKAEELKAAEEEARAALEHAKNVSVSAANATARAHELAHKTKNASSTSSPVPASGKQTATKKEAPLRAAEPKKKSLVLAKMQSCDAKQRNARSLIQEKLAVFGVQCEEMCKEMGVYPKCQCPGFAGQPADADDNRACIAKNCQDPTSPCPNDAFMTCVHETTKVSTLQWDALIQKFDVTMEAYKKSLAAMKGPLRCPAPLFIAEGQFCVCKDPENCPSTAETLTPEQAAKLAAEAHTWNHSGAPGTR